MVDSRAIVDQREVVSKVSKEICRDSEVSSGSVFEVSSGKDLEVQLDLNSNKGRRKDSQQWEARFHFEAAWAGEEECSLIVDKSWLRGSDGNVMDSLKRSVSNVTAYLRDWNLKKKRSSNLELNMLKKELSQLYAIAGPNLNIEKIKDLEDLY
ncbi:hypothetical protein ACOSP7_009742 [Xanthoceras sorbifolium]